MPNPGQYPHRQQPPAAQPMSMDEFKPVKCAKCGEVKRRTIKWVEHVQHRLQPKLGGRVEREVWFCLGCNAQVDDRGQALPADHADRLKPEEIAKMMEDFR
jgi:hypothetical protein